MEDLAKTILYYLEHDDERRRIVDSAYELATGELTFHNSIKQIMQAVEQMRLSQAMSQGSKQV
jgi:spore maturation protein CgeB